MHVWLECWFLQPTFFPNSVWLSRMIHFLTMSVSSKGIVLFTQAECSTELRESGLIWVSLNLNNADHHFCIHAWYSWRVYTLDRCVAFCSGWPRTVHRPDRLLRAMAGRPDHWQWALSGRTITNGEMFLWPVQCAWVHITVWYRQSFKAGPIMTQ